MAVNPYIALKESFLNNKNREKENDLKQLTTGYNANRQTTNSQYDKGANNVYVNYRQNERKLPEQLASQGLTGGASESANIRLQTAYGNNLGKNEDGRNSTLAQLLRDYNNKHSTISNNYAKMINSGILDYDAKIAEWAEAERLRKEEEAKRLAAMSGYGGYGGGGGGGGYYSSGGSSGGSSSTSSGGKGSNKNKNLVSPWYQRTRYNTVPNANGYGSMFISPSLRNVSPMTNKGLNDVKKARSNKANKAKSDWKKRRKSSRNRNRHRSRVWGN